MFVRIRIIIIITVIIFDTRLPAALHDFSENNAPAIQQLMLIAILKSEGCN